MSSGGAGDREGARIPKDVNTGNIRTTRKREGEGERRRRIVEEEREGSGKGREGEGPFGLHRKTQKAGAY